ncbi:MAG: NusG domain II-containing protein [Ignavibacteria bacterium]|nr:NusG domain II-containing protein [Ignavibacteria bacterium]
MLKILTAADKILIGTVISIIVASFFALSAFSVQGSTVLIQVDGKTVHKMNLNESRLVTITGTRGELHIETKDGKIAVTYADCPQQVCVRTGWRFRSGDLIVCVPNKTVVCIMGDESEEIKAVTG